MYFIIMKIIADIAILIVITLVIIITIAVNVDNISW